MSSYVGSRTTVPAPGLVHSLENQMVESEQASDESGHPVVVVGVTSYEYAEHAVWGQDGNRAGT